MRSHLSALHPSDCAAMEREKKEDTSDASTSIKSKSSPVENQLPAHSSCFPRAILGEKLTDSVCYFIAKDMLPFDTVYSAGFLHLVNTFEPQYQPGKQFQHTACKFCMRKRI